MTDTTTADATATQETQTAEQTTQTTETQTETEPQKTKQDYIIERQIAQKEKAKEEASNYETKYNEAMAELNKVKEATTQPEPTAELEDKFNQRFDDFSRQQSIQDFTSKNPELAEFSGLVAELSKEEGAKGLNTKALFHAVAGEKIAQLAVENYKKELAEGRQGAGPTTTANPVAVNTDWSKADDKDFLKAYEAMQRM